MIRWPESRKFSCPLHSSIASDQETKVPSNKRAIPGCSCSGTGESVIKPLRHGEYSYVYEYLRLYCVLKKIVWCYVSYNFHVFSSGKCASCTPLQFSYSFKIFILIPMKCFFTLSISLKRCWISITVPPFRNSKYQMQTSTIYIYICPKGDFWIGVSLFLQYRCVHPTTRQKGWL
jgi:hypothetical protein